MKARKLRPGLHAHIHTHQETTPVNYEDAMEMVSIEECKLNEEEQKQEKDKGTREWEGV